MIDINIALARGASGMSLKVDYNKKLSQEMDKFGIGIVAKYLYMHN